VHIQWDTSANGVGAGTAIIQLSPNNTLCQITDMKMTDNNCSCSILPPPVSKKG
jgi:ribosomal protein S11